MILSSKEHELNDALLFCTNKQWKNLRSFIPLLWTSFRCITWYWVILKVLLKRQDSTCATKLQVLETQKFLLNFWGKRKCKTFCRLYMHSEYVILNTFPDHLLVHFSLLPSVCIACKIINISIAYHSPGLSSPFSIRLVWALTWHQRYVCGSFQEHW